jgi:hypothetical protein
MINASNVLSVLAGLAGGSYEPGMFASLAS